MVTSVKTPCIGVCSTGIGDSVCRGCKRYAHEIIAWNGYAENERLAIVNRIDQLLAQVVQERVQIMDTEKLLKQMAMHRLTVRDGRDGHCLAFEAIRAFGAQLPSLEVIGCQPRRDWAHLTIVELKRSIDEAFFHLSQAHYDRYFPGGL